MPADRCSVLFYPRRQSEPLVAGDLRLLPGLKGSVFQYSEAFLADPRSMALDPIGLSLRTGELVTPRDGDFLVPDAFSDAGPDAWGRTMLDRVANLERSSEFDYLLAAGPNRTGALDFRANDARQDVVTPGVDDLADIERAIDQVRRKLPIDERYRLLLALGTSAGGMRPKTFVEKDAHLWIAKFNARNEDFDAVAMEYAGLELAARCGIEVPPFQKHQFGDGKFALLVRRFDREPLGGGGYGRIPFVSARTLLRGYGRENLGAVPSEYSYVELADVRRLVGDEVKLTADLRELFRRMVFNILIDNTDDHERNHGFLHDDGWRLAPAFDLSSQATGLGYQSMVVGADNTGATLDNALSHSGRFGLSQDEARELVAGMIVATEGLEETYREARVDPDRVAAVLRIREKIVGLFGNSAPGSKRKG